MTIHTRQTQDARRQKWGPRGTAAATFAGRLTFENVSLSFGAVEAVRNVSFELLPGEIITLLGPSGCGKTTLLRIAAGVERPTMGRVLIDGMEVAGPSRFMPPEKRGVGLMYQDFALFPHLTIIENVAFGLRSLPRNEALSEAKKALARVGLADYAQSFPHALSGGEQQRVALARAIVPRPQVMLMDEPFSGLDQRLRENVRAETLTLLRETRATTMLVTHDPIEAMALSDRILLMRQGRLVQVGTPAQLYNHPVDAQAARFFCDLNELNVMIRNGHAETPLGAFPAPAIPDGTPAIVMIRPQDFSRPVGDVGVEGFIVSARFLGDAFQCAVIFKGIEDPLNVRLAARNAPSAGQSAYFTVDPAQVLVFPAAGEVPI